MHFNICRFNTIFQYGWKPVLIHQILIGFEVLLEKYLRCSVSRSTISHAMKVISFLQGKFAKHLSKINKKILKTQMHLLKSTLTFCLKILSLEGFDFYWKCNYCNVYMKLDFVKFPLINGQNIYDIYIYQFIIFIFIY